MVTPYVTTGETVAKKLPTVFYSVPDTKKVVEIQDNYKLSSTDKVLISLLQKSTEKAEIFKQLDYKKQKKIQPYVFCKEHEISFDIEIMSLIALKIYEVIEPDDFCIIGTSYAPIPM